MESGQFEAARRHMVDSQLRTNGIVTPWIVAAMSATPREEFMPAEKAAFAYLDRSVLLPGGRMLNPPLAAAQILQSADIGVGDKVLIIGAGTGYLAALLGARTAQIVAVESDTALAAIARAKVAGLQLVEAPLSEGWPEGAPYDRILVDGAIQQLPTAFADQLAEGGRIVTGLAEGAVLRLATGVKHGGQIALRTVADLEVAPLPGFEKPKEFVF